MCKPASIEVQARALEATELVHGDPQSPPKNAQLPETGGWHGQCNMVVQLPLHPTNECKCASMTPSHLGAPLFFALIGSAPLVLCGCAPAQIVVRRSRAAPSRDSSKQRNCRGRHFAARALLAFGFFSSHRRPDRNVLTFVAAQPIETLYVEAPGRELPLLHPRSRSRRQLGARAITRAKLTSGPQPVPGGSRVATLADPEGAAFALQAGG